MMNAARSPTKLEQSQLDLPVCAGFGPFSSMSSGRDVRALIVVAHPDDESIAVGGQLGSWPSACVVHLTQGAPAHEAFAHVAGFSTQAEYAQTRALELSRALQLAGLDRTRRYSLGYVDQQACYSMVELTCQLGNLIEQLRPELVITHAYEGGHPDHDAAAFIVQAACARHLQKTGLEIPILEAPFYHLSRTGLQFGRFLGWYGAVLEFEVLLSESQRTLKTQMLDCFASQADVLAPFARDRERFRIAPAYDFCALAHPRPLHYETLGWNVNGAEWIKCAKQALATLKLPVAQTAQTFGAEGAV